MVCSSPFSKQKCENLKTVRLMLLNCNSLRSDQFMTRATHQQFWYTGVVLIIKLNHYFMVSVNPKTFWPAFEIIPHPHDAASLRLNNKRIHHIQKWPPCNFETV